MNEAHRLAMDLRAANLKIAELTKERDDLKGCLAVARGYQAKPCGKCKEFVVVNSGGSWVCDNCGERGTL